MKPNARYFPPIDFKQRFPALDGIRALAVTLVFLAHYGGGAHGGRILQLINDLRLTFGIGVDIFFVLSGFLITGILFDTQSDSRPLFRFFARRSVRIFPVFYLVCAVLLALTPFVGYIWHPAQALFLIYMGNFAANQDFSLYSILSTRHPIWQVNIAHLWSLCVEEQFYLLWPFAVFFIRSRIKLLWTAAALSVLSFLLRLMLYHHLGEADASTWIGRTLPFRMDDLLLGAMLALLLRGPRADRWQRLCRPCFLICTSLMAILFYLYPDYNSLPRVTFGLTIVALAAAGLIGCTLRAGSPVFRLFYWKPFRILGKYSYGFYIFHLLFIWAWIRLLVFVTHLLHSRALAGVLVLALNFAVTFLVSKLSYDHFEVKFLRLKRHFEYDSEIAQDKHAFTTK